MKKTARGLFAFAMVLLSIVSAAVLFLASVHGPPVVHEAHTLQKVFDSLTTSNLIMAVGLVGAVSFVSAFGHKWIGRCSNSISVLVHYMFSALNHYISRVMAVIRHYVPASHFKNSRLCGST